MGKFSLLGLGESPIAVENTTTRGDIVIVCEHASHLIPPTLGDLGLDASALTSHIARDPGALEVAGYLSSSLDAFRYCQSYSRLVYDCDRPPEAASAIVGRSEIYDVPGNQNISEAERLARVNEIYLPFRDGLPVIFASRKIEGRQTLLLPSIALPRSIPARIARSRLVYSTMRIPGSRTRSSPRAANIRPSLPRQHDLRPAGMMRAEFARPLAWFLRCCSQGHTNSLKFISNAIFGSLRSFAKITNG